MSIIANSRSMTATRIPIALGILLKANSLATEGMQLLKKLNVVVGKTTLQNWTKCQAGRLAGEVEEQVSEAIPSISLVK